MIKVIRRRWLDIAVLACYSVLATIYAWPLMRRFGVALAGDGYDMYVFQWANWSLARWVKASRHITPRCSSTPVVSISTFSVFLG